MQSALPVLSWFTSYNNSVLLSPYCSWSWEGAPCLMLSWQRQDLNQGYSDWQLSLLATLLQNQIWRSDAVQIFLALQHWDDKVAHTISLKMLGSVHPTSMCMAEAAGSAPPQLQALTPHVFNAHLCQAYVHLKFWQVMSQLRLLRYTCRHTAYLNAHQRTHICVGKEAIKSMPWRIV